MPLLLLQAAPQIDIPHEIFFSIIGALVVLVVSIIAVFGGLWIRTHDKHREWTTERVSEIDKIIAVLKTEYAGVRDDIAEIKTTLKNHLEIEEQFQETMLRRFNLRRENNHKTGADKA